MYTRFVQILASIIVLLACASLTGAAEHKSKPSTIEVVGTAKIMVKPNRATITFAVETTAAKAQKAATENAERTAGLLNALKKISGEDAKIKTAGYSLSPVYEQENRIGPKGYRARNSVILETNNLDKLGVFIDEATAAGVNRMGSLAFSTDEEEQFRREAAVEAVRNAREIAARLAEAAGLSIKKIIKLTYGPGQAVRPYRVEAMAARARTPIEVGEIPIEERVSVVFEVD